VRYPPIICQECDHPNRPNARFCAMCGTPTNHNQDDNRDEIRLEDGKNDSHRPSSRKSMLVSFAVFVVVIAALAAYSSFGVPATAPIDSISGLPICKEADLWIAATNEVTVGNLNEDCAVQRVTVTLNGNFQCPSINSLGASAVIMAVTDCVDKGSGERFNSNTHAASECRLEVQKPRVYKRRCPTFLNDF